MIYNNNIPKNTIIQTGYVVSTTYVNGVAVCEINSDMSPNLKYTGFFQYLQPGILCNIPNNTKVALAFSPNKHVGGVTGAVNIIPEDNTTLDLQPGEVALTNIDNFNYTIQSKLKGLYAIFDNGNKGSPFTSSTLIGQAVVDILKDIIAEINLISSNYNLHTHLYFPGPIPTPPVPTVVSFPPVPQYTPQPAIATDNTYLEDAKCYVDDSGEYPIE